MAAEVGYHQLEGLGDEEEEGEVIRLPQEDEEEVALEGAEGSPFLTVPE